MPTCRAVQIENSRDGENNAITQDSNNKKRKESSATENNAIIQDSNNKKRKESYATEKEQSKTKSSAKSSSAAKDTPEARFVGLPIQKDEAKRHWPERYDSDNKQSEDNASDRKPKNTVENSEEAGPAGFAKHYSKAEVDGATFELGDCVYVHSGGEQEYIGRIVEFFEDTKGEPWITAQWFFRIQDTAVKDVCESKHNKKRVYYSEVKDYNPLDSVVSKINIVKLSPLHHFNVLNPKPIPPCDFYFDMGYDYAYSRFYSLPTELEATNSGSDVTFCNDVSNGRMSGSVAECKSEIEVDSGKVQLEYTLLDLYSGCGGMSTGLCSGASLSAVKLVTKWALDLNPNACKSLEFNHPETQVRNESAEDFLILLKEWRKLCDQYTQSDNVKESKLRKRRQSSLASHEEDDDDSKPTRPGEYEVEKIVGIRHVSPPASEKPGIEMKVRWKGYGPNDDTWESLDGLSSCQDCVKKFVIEGKKMKILPLPGDVDVICGGPPCQGASGFNRFRNKEEPLADPRNKQIVIYMDIVNYLKARFVLMENVVDILRFADGLLGRYALSRLVQMHYQAMLGMMVAGCYGLPQFRMRVMLWGAAPTERLPAFPLPTHDVVQKGGIPVEWERNMVAYDENTKPKLLSPLTLGDALRDLPPVENSEGRDEMSYAGGPQTEFQRFIRLPKEVLTGASSLSSCNKKQKIFLHDHRPLELNKDDYQRVCRIPRKKGANFRNLPGVIVKDDNRVMLDPDMERVLLPSGKPLVPDYAITFVEGRSSKPFARLWWDETVPTVVTRAEPHNQAILHPEQDRVLTIRENARVQGFPDYYKLFGPVKQRYIQVGNAVAVPVGRALGYSLALSIKNVSTVNPTMVLPNKFPHGLMKAAQYISDIPLEVENVDDAQ